MRIHNLSRRIVLSMVSLVAGLPLVSCTREIAKDANISMAVPLKDNAMKKGSSALTTSGDLDLIVLNLRNPSGGLSMCQWKRPNQDGRPGYQEGPCDFAQIGQGILRIQVAPGANQLIQVMFVYESQSTGQLAFHYGDTNANLVTGDNQVNLAIARLPQVLGRSGRVMGQALLNGTVGLNGEMEIRAKPVASRPSMLISRSEIYNGWFQAFALDDIPVEYLVRGQSLLGSPRTLAELLLVADSTSQGVGVSDPVHALAHSNGLDFEIAGYFGDLGQGTNRRICTTTTCKTTEFPSHATEFSNFLSFNSGDFESRFQGPYAVTSGSQGMLDLNTSTGVATWRYLPLASGQISGSSVFIFRNATETNIRPFFRGEKQLDCGMLASDSRAVRIADVLYPTSSIQIPANLLNPNNLAIVCPNVDGKLMKSVVTYPDIFSGGDGGGNQGPYLRFEIDMAFVPGGGGAYALTQNFCHRVQAKLYQGAGQPYTGHTSALTITGIASTAGSFYTDPNCSSGMVSPVSIPLGAQGSSPFYFQASTPIATATAQITALLSDTTITYQPNYNAFSVQPPQIAYEGPTNITSGACYMARVRIRMATGMDYNAPSSGFTVNLDSLAGASYVGNNNTCSGTSSSHSVSIPSGSSNSSPFFVKVDNDGRVLRATVSAQSQFLPVIWTYGVTGFHQVSSMEIVPVSSPVVAGLCQLMLVRLRNQAGAFVPANTTLTIPMSLPADRGHIFNDTNCGARADSVVISEGEHARMFSVRYFFSPVGAGDLVNFLVPPGMLGFGAAGDLAMQPIMVMPNLMPDFLEIQYPDLKGRTVVGSHEFSTPILIPIRMPLGKTLECRRFGPTVTDPGFSTANCGSWVSGSNLTWDQTKALVSNDGVEIRYIGNFGHEFLARFQPSQIYGTNFKVYPCTQTYTAAPSFTALKSALESAGTQVICLGPSVTVDTSSVAPGVLSMSPSGGGDVKALIGHSSRTSTFNMNSLSGGGMDLSIGNLGSSSRVVIANLIFTKQRNATLLKINSTSIDATSKIEVFDSSFGTIANRLEATAISSATVTASLRDLVVRNSEFHLNPFPNNSTLSAVDLQMINSHANIELLNLKVRGVPNSSSTVNTDGIALRGMNNTGMIRVRDLDYVGDGVGVFAESTSTTQYLNNLEVSGSRIELQNPHGGLLTKAIDLRGASNFNLIGNYFVAGVLGDQNYAYPFVKITTLNVPVTGQFTNNVLVNRSTDPTGMQQYLSLFASVSSPVTLNEFRRNQFVADTGSTLGYTTNPISVSASIHSISVGASAQGPHGDNILCARANPSTSWTGLIGGGSLVTTTNPISDTAVNTTCKHNGAGASVLASGNCAKACQ